MARKEVDLVIRARDQAAKVVDQITTAVNAFNTAQGKMASGADKTQVAMADLGAAFSRLDIAMKGLVAGDKIARDFARAKESTEGLKSELAATEQRFASTGRAAAQMEEYVERLTGKVDRATKALATQQARLRDSTAQHRDLKTQLDATNARYERSGAAVARASAAVEKSNIALDAAKAKYEGLKAQIAATETPTKRLSASFEASERAVGRATAAVTKNVAAESAARQQRDEAARALPVLREQFARLSVETDRNNRIVERSKAALDGHKVAVRSARVAHAQLTEQNGRASTAAERLRADYARASGEMNTLRDRADAAAVSIRQLAQAGTRGARNEGLRQREELAAAVSGTGSEHAAVTREISKMATEIGRVGVPTREMAAAFEQAKNRARALKTETSIMRVALEETRRAFAAMDGTVEGNRRGLQAMVAAEEKMISALSRTRTEANRTATAIRQMHTAGSVGAGAARIGPVVTPRESQELSRYATLMRVLGHEKRTALSWTQRLRGEVISLATAYVGVFGAVRAINAVIEATKQLEAATNRISVATGQSATRTAQEMDFLRRTADRLGIPLSVLADEYSKLAVAADAAGFQAQNIRTLFLSVAESARVNKNSTEQMSGIFLALTQMISKGKIVSEELRRQLGDRLPGAFNIMADAIGVSTAELDKLMSTGQLLADQSNMLAFADELTQRFGPQLATALLTTTTQLGRLENEVFKTSIAFGEAGFIDAFNDMLRDLVEVLRSPEFKTSMERLSAGIAVVVDALAWLIRNFQLVAMAATSLIGVKVYATFLQVSAALHGSNAAAVAASQGMGIFARSTTRAVVGIRALTASVRAFAASTGVGLAFVAAGALIGKWMTDASSVNEVLQEHLRIMDAVRNAYDETGGSLAAWRAAITQNVTVSEMQDNLADLREELQGLTTDLQTTGAGGSQFWTNIFWRDLSTGRAAIDRTARASAGLKTAMQSVIASFVAGNIAAGDLVTQLNAAAQAAGNGTREDIRYARQVIDAARKVEELSEAVDNTTDSLTAATGATVDAEAALERVSGATVQAANAAQLAAQRFEEFTAIMDSLGGKIASVKRELDYLKASDAITEQMQEAIALADTWGQVVSAIQRAGQAQRDLRDNYYRSSTVANVTGSLYDWFVREEGMRTTAYQDQGGVWTIGLGHTSAAGGMPVGPGTTITEAQALELFDQDIARFAARVDNAVRVPITDAMRTALISYDYNTGAIVGSRIVELLNAGDYAGAQDALRHGINTIQGTPSAALTARRGREADLFGSQGLSSAEIEQASGRREVDQAKEAADEAERRAQAAADFHSTQAASIEQSNFELSVQDQALVARETALAIREAELAAQEAGTVLTQQERDAIAANVEARFRQKQIEEEAADAKKRATDAEERINQLMTQRQALQEQMRNAVEDGDTSRAEELRARIEEINQQLIEAIANAQAMWAAVGGPEAETAIMRLDTAREAAERFNREGRQSLIDWKRVGDLFVDGLANAFSDFSKAVAEGTRIGEAARNAFLKFAADFLIQIGQMIVKQAILNSLRGTSLGGLMGIGVAVGHTGLVVGSGGGSRRTVSPALFAGAARYHSGGFPGLRPNEVPIIAERGEQILAKDDPANIMNSGAGGSSGRDAAPPRPLKIVNRLASRDVASAVFDEEDGSEVIENYFRMNAAKISAILSGG